MEPLVPDDDESTVEALLELDAQGVESLRLELRRLAKRHGVTIEHLLIEPVE